MLSDVSVLPVPCRRDTARALTHRNALDAALRKAAILERLDPSGDPYGAAGQALEDFVKREAQIVARGEDVSGWISIVTERRWINELRYQRRRGYERLDAPVAPAAISTLGDLTAARQATTEEVVELRERLTGLAVEQRAALAYLRAARVQPRHVRIVELALSGERAHQDIACIVNAEFAGPMTNDLGANTITQIIGRQRDRLVRHGAFPSVVQRLCRTRRAA
jgi:hypothetical protein